MNRRRLLRESVSAAGLGAAALLAACSSARPATPTAPAAPATRAAAAPPAAAPTGVVASPAAAPAATAQTTGGTPVSGGTYEDGGDTASSDIATLDPQVSAWNGISAFGNLVFDPLVYEDPEKKTFVPGLALTWEAAPDATSYTFHLRKDVTFHDGTPLDAKAVQFNFDRVADPATKSQLASTLLGPYDRTEVVDDSTVTVHFKEPFAAFLDGASRSNLGIASPTAIKKYGADYGRYPTGTGIFKIKDWVVNSHIDLVQNPDYNWGPPIWQKKGAAYLAGYALQSLPEQAAAQAAFDRGEIYSAGMDYKLLPRYDHNPKYYILRYVYSGFPSSYLQNVTRPPTDDLNVRKALIYAVDQETVVKIGFHGFVQPAHGVLTPPSFGYDPSVEKMYRYDPAMAKQLLDAAGWKPGPDGIRVKDGKRCEVIFVASTGWEPYAIPVQPMYKAVGVDMKIQILSSAARSATNLKGDVNLAGLGFSNSDPYVLSNIFLSKNIDHGFNWTKFRSADLDNLLTKAAGTGDLAQRKSLYGQIQKMIMENALTVPIVAGNSVTAYPSFVHDVTLDARGFAWLHDTWLGPKS